MNIINAVLVLWVHVDLLVIKWSVCYFCGIAVDQFPFESAIITFIQAVTRGFYLGVYPGGHAAGKCDPDTSQVPFRHTIFLSEFFPVLTSINSDIHSAAGSTAFEPPGKALVLPHGGDQLIGVGRIHDQL